MPQLFLNNFQTQFIASVKAAPDSASPALELDYGVLRVSDGAAGVLLNPAAGNWYVLTAFKRSGSAESDYEVLHVTAVDNAVLGECRLSVLRGQEGTTPKSYVPGDVVELRLTAGGMGQYVQTTDARMSNPRVPAGAAGGVLSGTYPNPGFAQAMATAAELGGKVDKVAGKVLSANDFTNAERVKLANIAEQATQNAADDQLRDRSTHTGAQAISTITGLETALAGKQAALESGVTIKTLNGVPILGEGDIPLAQETGLLPQNAQSAAYTLSLADIGKHVLHPAADTTARTFTIPANAAVAFPIGAAITFVNQNGTGGVVTIAITTDVMRLAGAGTTGSRTLARNGIATALKIAATEWIISGSGLT